MGQFSWIDCVKRRKAIKDNVPVPSYLLVPEDFGGGHVEESCYDGYGHFGPFDVYEKVAEWNRDSLSEDMLRPVSDRSKFGGLYGFEKEDMRKKGMTEAQIQAAEEAERDEHYNAALKRHEVKRNRLSDYRDEILTDGEMKEKYGQHYLREIGIDIAGHDEQNKKLPYPIKITYDSTAVFEECMYSRNDPNQGW